MLAAAAIRMRSATHCHQRSPLSRDRSFCIICRGAGSKSLQTLRRHWERTSSDSSFCDHCTHHCCSFCVCPPLKASESESSTLAFCTAGLLFAFFSFVRSISMPLEDPKSLSSSSRIWSSWSSNIRQIRPLQTALVRQESTQAVNYRLESAPGVCLVTCYPDDARSDCSWSRLREPKGVHFIPSELCSKEL